MSDNYNSYIREQNTWNKSKLLAGTCHTARYMVRFHYMQAAVEYIGCCEPHEVTRATSIMRGESAQLVSYGTPILGVTSIPSIDVTEDSSHCAIGIRDCFKSSAALQAFCESNDIATALFYAVTIRKRFMHFSISTTHQMTRFMNEACFTTDITMPMLDTLYKDWRKNPQRPILFEAAPTFDTHPFMSKYDATHECLQPVSAVYIALKFIDD